MDGTPRTDTPFRSEVIERLTRIETHLETVTQLAASHDKRLDRLDQFRLVVLVVLVTLGSVVSLVIGGNVAWATDLIQFLN